MQNSSIRHIIILGGGSAGWMSAASIANAIQDNCKITVVESDRIGTIGVGEATIPPIKGFNKSLGIDEHEFLKATKGTYKLGIEFVNWAKDEHSYFHPFGSYGVNFDPIPFYQFWLKEKHGSSLNDFSMAWHLAKNAKFERPQTDPSYIMSTFDYAYHFDANLYADYLRKYTTAKGVERIEGTVESVYVDHQSGTIKSLTLESGKTISADFFIDCTGFQSLLIEKALNSGYVDWRHWLPCDRAVAVQSAHSNRISPYTKSIARPAGWQWQIPLQHRMGNGYVYCSKFITDEEAKNELIENIDGDLLTEPKVVHFKAGKRTEFWKGNCLSIGLSSGFLEPLESTSLHLVQTAISRFLSLFPSDSEDVLSSQEYNRLTSDEYDEVRDFLILHYYANQRQEGEFWHMCAQTNIPDSLRYKIEQFAHNGRIVARETDLFREANWVAVLVGQNIIPKNYDPLIDLRPKVQHKRFIKDIKQVIVESAKMAMTQADYINKYCKSE
ncbi:tryptophan halogenase family protein [Thalassotalea hakodatensis]|uniref:tryptophan halogenase family protein n=1 Tax=Thalassotalea hakodatensis TaxID=3030492 RepID=UPI0025730C7C|nr:tryptophan halogenase family protein [Thalassotalea hakodatensis]